MTIEDHYFAAVGEQNEIDHRIDEQNPIAFSQKNDPSIAAKIESNSNVLDQASDKGTMNNDGDDIIMQSKKESPNHINGQRYENGDTFALNNVHVKHEENVHNNGNGVSISNNAQQNFSSPHKSIKHPIVGTPDQAIPTEEVVSVPNPILSSSSSTQQSPSNQTPQKLSNRSSNGQANQSPSKLVVLNGNSPKRFKRPEPILSRNFAPLPQETPVPSQVEGNSNGSKRLERKSKVSVFYYYRESAFLAPPQHFYHANRQERLGLKIVYLLRFPLPFRRMLCVFGDFFSPYFIVTQQFLCI